MIFAIVGPSGSGKTTLSDLMRKYGAEAVVSTTTRPPRSGERDGVDYHFVTEESFLQKISQGEFVEHARFGKNYYGATKSAFKQALEKSPNNCAVLVCEINGFRSLKAAVSGMGQYLTGVFLSCSRDVIEKRLQNRHRAGGLTPEQFAERISLIDGELSCEFEIAQEKSSIVITSPTMEELEDYALVLVNSSSRLVVPPHPVSPDDEVGVPRL